MGGIRELGEFMPRISIITAAFNADQTIEQCIRSVARQTVRAEHIVIDAESSLLPDLVERLHPPDCFHPDFRLELGAVHLAFLDLTHAIVLLGRQLKPVS